MLRWLRKLLRRRSRPIAVDYSMMRPEVPPGRRRMSTTVEEFEEHLAKKRAEREQR